MSDKQLTVAELMARAAKEGHEATPKRRRRRSLEDGGISVAELTGSLPKVAATPEQPRHSSEPIDDPRPAPAPAPAKPAAPAAPAVSSKPAAPAVSSKPAAPAKPVPAKSADPATEPTITVVHDNDPIKLTTDSFPAQKAAPAAPVAAPAPAAPQPAPSLAVDDAAETGVLPVATDEPAELVTFEDDVEEAEGRVSILNIIGMVIFGVVLGAAIFLGFKMLWMNLNPIFVGALAGAMTLGMVGVVHALRTDRDTASMVLALITGIALTFGPLLVIGL